jgi:hypothetical protein
MDSKSELDDLLQSNKELIQTKKAGMQVPAIQTGTSRSPGSRLLLFKGYVASAFTPRFILLISSESRMQPFTIKPCKVQLRIIVCVPHESSIIA